MKIIILFLIFILTIPSYAETQTKSLTPSKDLITKADIILDLIKSADFKSLTNHVHPIKGLNFSPYTRDLSKLFIINFSKKEVSNFERKYINDWRQTFLNIKSVNYKYEGQEKII